MLPLCLLGVHFGLENTVRLAQERNIVHALPDAAGNTGEQSENHIDYRLGAVQRKYDLQVDEQRVAFVKEAAGVVAELPGRGTG